MDKKIRIYSQVKDGKKHYIPERAKVVVESEGDSVEVIIDADGDIVVEESEDCGTLLGW